MAAAPVRLPCGLWREERRLCEVGLRPWTGDRAEAFLAAQGELTARRASALLAGCVEAPGADALETVRSLAVGDREALLLHLRRISFGDRMESTVHCPAPPCGEGMALELRASELLVPPYRDARPVHALEVDDGGSRWALSFRLPTGADQEEAAAWARAGDEGALAALVRRCVLSATRDGRDVAAGELPPAVVAALSDAAADLDPQAELQLELVCPACGHAFAVVFDTASFLLQELDREAERLLREVHALALHYHWSEHDILRLPPRRRARYLELLAESTGARAAR